MLSCTDRNSFFESYNKEEPLLAKEEERLESFSNGYGIWYDGDCLKYFNIPVKGNKNLDRITKEDIAGDGFVDKIVVLLNKDKTVDSIFVPDSLRDDMVDDEVQTDIIAGVK